VSLFEIQETYTEEDLALVQFSLKF